MILNFIFVLSNFRCLKFAVVKKFIKCDKKSDYFQCDFPVRALSVLQKEFGCTSRRYQFIKYN